MSFNSSLNPDVVKTLLDGVFFPKFDEGDTHPGYINATSGLAFQQDSTDLGQVTMDIFKGVGSWEARGEEQEVSQGNPRVANSKTFTVTNFDRAVDIPKIFFDDQKHSSYENMVKSFARRAITTRDKNAFAVFRNGFTTALTADGATVFSDTHTNLNGDTVDNKITAVLAESALNTAIIQLVEMKSQDGELDGYTPNTLLVPPALFKLATEICESEYKSGGSNNDTNVYSSKYGIYVATSRYLGAAAGGSDTAWFLLSKEHSVMRFVRESVWTSLNDWRLTRNNSYTYKGGFREVVGALTYEGIIGSTGLG